ncbi:MAG: type VI secretion system protein TssA [Thermodesulfobacteriota bacterium]
MSWLNEVATPLAGEGAGEDPAYDDNFVQIKEEINKLQANDYPLIEELAAKILTETSKDLRVAGYYLLAATFNRGVAGLREGVGAYRLITENFWDTCHPRRPRAREAALRWLNTPKLELYAREYAGEGGSEDYQTIGEALAAVNGQAEQLETDEPPVWNILNQWLAEQVVEEEPSAEQEEEITTPGQQTATPPAKTTRTAPPAQPAGEVSSDLELQNSTRAIRAYLLSKKEYLQAAAYSRALRWGALKQPPHDNRKTRLPAMRAAALNQLENATGNQTPEEVFLLSEELFFEPGGQVNLDLQMAAARAAAGMGRQDIADYLSDQLLNLLERLPELANLQFDNGEPFAAAETRQWLEELQEAKGTSSGEAGGEKSDAWQQGLQEITGQARELLGQKKLSQGLNLLHDYPAASDRQQLLRKLAQASLCQEAKRHDIALPLLQELSEMIEEQDLQNWEPQLAIEVWGRYLDSMKTAQKKAKAEEKSQLASQIDKIMVAICRVNPGAAARLL